MLITTPRRPSDTMHASHVCACVDCKRAARKLCDCVLAAMSFDLAYRALRASKDLRALAAH